MISSNIPQFRVSAPNGDYMGKTLGVQFTRGMAILDENTVPARLGRTVNETAVLFLRDWQTYQVEPLTEDAQQVIEEWQASQTQAAHEPKRLNVVRRVPNLKKNVIVAREGDYRTEK